jgi:SAM-dependent methyltransferase
MCDVTVFSGAQGRAAKTPPRSPAETSRHLDMMLAIAKELGYRYQPTHRVLDFGCGIGDTVSVMLGRDIDAYGVDVGEWWAADHAAYWHDSPLPSTAVTARLLATKESAYRLPFPDNHFDFILSAQVFEHVLNYADVFRELGRVAKPGAISLHVFPGPGTPLEPHLGVPFTFLAHHSTWLRAWSLVRRRHHKGWRAEYEFLRDSMRSNNYPFRSQLERHAATAGVNLSFHEDLYIKASRGRPERLLAMFERIGLRWTVAPLIRSMCQRAMLIHKSSSDPGRN